MAADDEHDTDSTRTRSRSWWRRRSAGRDRPARGQADAPPSRFNFARDVVEALAADPGRACLTAVGRDGVIDRWTFQRMATEASRWAALLGERGVGRGDVVLVSTGPVADWLAATLGALKLGAVAALSERTSTEELARRAALVGARIVVIDEQPAYGVDAHVLRLGAIRSVLQVLPSVASTRATEAADPALILFTRGRTGGSARAVVHTHGALFAWRVPAELWLEAGPGDVVLCSVESGSAASAWNLLAGPWSRGAEIVLHNAPFDPEERWQLVDRLGVTVLCQPPDEYAALAALPFADQRRPWRLRHAVTTATLDTDTADWFRRTLGTEVLEGYALAETGVIVANTLLGGGRRARIGRPLPGVRIAIVDDRGQEVPPGDTGELTVLGRPATLFAGYLGEPETNVEGLAFATGDLVERDDSGFLRLVGRVPTRRGVEPVAPAVTLRPASSAEPPRARVVPLEPKPRPAAQGHAATQPAATEPAAAEPAAFEPPPSSPPPVRPQEERPPEPASQQDAPGESEQPGRRRLGLRYRRGAEAERAPEAEPEEAATDEQVTSLVISRLEAYGMGDDEPEKPEDPAP